MGRNYAVRVNFFLLARRRAAGTLLLDASDVGGVANVFRVIEEIPAVSIAVDFDTAGSLE